MGTFNAGKELITLNFNLRSKKVAKSPIYAVIRIGSKQYKLATLMSICPLFWDANKQVVKLNSSLSDSTLEEYVGINNKLSSIYNTFMVNFPALQRAHNEDELKLVFKEIVAPEVDNTLITNSKNAVKASTLINRYLDNLRAKVSAGSMRMYDSHAKAYLDYIVEKGLNDNAKVLFQQVQINAYKEYLTSNGESVNNINAKVSIVVRCVNHTINTSTTNYGLLPVTYKREADKRSKKENAKHFVLTPEEIEKLTNAKGLTERQKLYRNIMLMQYEFGQRESDMTTLLKGEYTILNDNIILKTLKEKTNSIIPIKLCEAGMALLKKWEADKSNVKLVSHLQNFRILYGLQIKKIAKKAGLDRVYTYINAKNEEETKPVYELLTSHSFRSSRATHLLAVVDKDVIVKMCGWSNDLMLDKVYGKETVEDFTHKINAAIAHLQRSRRGEIYGVCDSIPPILLVEGFCCFLKCWFIGG